MDISKASNFERFIYDLVGRDADRVRALFQKVETDGGFDLSGKPGSDGDEFSAGGADYGFVSGSSTHEDRLDTIRDVLDDYGITIDTHTADGIKVAREHIAPGVPMIVLETALAAKFNETILEALGMDAERPAGFEDIESLPQKFVVMPPDVDEDEGLHRRPHGPVSMKPRHRSAPMLAVREALDFLLAAARPVADIETVPTLEANGRVLAEAQASTHRRAVGRQHADGWLRGARRRLRQRRRHADGQPAHPGRPGRPAAAAGQAARIFTGAMIPEGADAVVMQEQCEALAPDQVIDPPRAAERRMDPPRRRRHHRRRGHPAGRHAPAQPGAGPCRIGRPGQRAGAAASCAWRCSSPATS